jgi:hypothetical protein
MPHPFDLYLRALHLYDNKGDNCQYKKRNHAKILADWDDHNQILTIGSQQESYPAMPKGRIFHIFIVLQASGMDIDSEDRPGTVVRYNIAT